MILIFSSCILLALFSIRFLRKQIYNHEIVSSLAETRRHLMRLLQEEKVSPRSELFRFIYRSTSVLIKIRWNKFFWLIPDWEEPEKPGPRFPQLEQDLFELQKAIGETEFKEFISTFCKGALRTTTKSNLKYWVHLYRISNPRDKIKAFNRMAEETKVIRQFAAC